MIGLTPESTAATAVRHGVVRVTFANGLSAELDVLDRMRGPVFVDARAPEGFAKVAVDPQSGTVVWPGGADLAPDTLTSERGRGRCRTASAERLVPRLTGGEIAPSASTRVDVTNLAFAIASTA